MEKQNGRKDHPRLKLLLVGALPPPIGGISILFQYLVRDLSTRRDVAVSIVDMARIQRAGWKKIFHGFRVFSQIALRARHVDVISLHTGTASLHLSGPAVSFLGRLFGKPVIIRKCAGTDYQSYGWFRRTLIRWALRHADLCLVETKLQVRAARADNIGRVEWFPNNRPMVSSRDLPAPRSGACRRFVFLSQVKETKGVLEIIQAAERFDRDITVDVYGPFFDGMSEDAFIGLKNVSYRGVVPGKDVISVLGKYDALLLPTYHSGEGYPGILIEAFSACIPVICTRWLSLPEIVDESSGILIEPRDADALFDAMKKLLEDEAFYARLREGAAKKRLEYSTEKWTENFVKYCRKLANS